MDEIKNQILDRLKQANNVLVTVSNSPSVDQLSAAIGITLLLNHIGKHATAVFSGSVPSTLEFLQPEKTLEKNTDSLRDFIIALDKSKADKLRYKVEDQMVKIFITPYRVSISDKDLEFSQGDFNVEAVLALGVNEQKDLDQAITSHGRILHDATVIGINTQGGSNLGNLNLVKPEASSLCEIMASLGLEMKADVLDGQMATAFLTGIVAETERFSNAKTSSQAMQLSAKLMASGANQQLIASQLQPKPKVTEKPKVAKSTLNSKDNNKTVDIELPEVKEATEADKNDDLKPNEADGSLSIDHGNSLADLDEANNQPTKLEQIEIDDQGRLKPLADGEISKTDMITPQNLADTSGSSRLILQPPTLGGTLTANSKPEALDPSNDPLGFSAPQGPMLNHDVPSSSNGNLPSKGSENQPDNSELVPSSDLNAARDAVNQAVSSAPSQKLEPVQALNANPIDLNLGNNAFDSSQSAQQAPIPAEIQQPVASPRPVDPLSQTDTAQSNVQNPIAPPPVPPPMMPPPPPLVDPNSPGNTAL